MNLNRFKIYAFVSVSLLVSCLFANDKPFEQISKQRERWSDSMTFEWEARVKDTIFPHRYRIKPSSVPMPPETKSYTTQLIIRKTPQEIQYEMTRFGQNLRDMKSVDPGEIRDVIIHRNNTRIRKIEYLDKRMPSPPVEVWHCPGECRRQFDAAIMFFRPDVYIFVAADYFEPMYNTQWTIQKVSDSTVTLLGKNPEGFDPELDRTFKLTLDAKKQFHPSQLEVFEGIETKPGIFVKVKSWQRVADYWLPNEVYVNFTNGVNNPIAILEYTLKLKRVSKTGKLRSLIDKGDQTFDYRLLEGGLSDKNVYYNAKVDNFQTSYLWQEDIPSDAELRKMALEQGKLPKEPGGARYSWLLLLPGILLVGGGILYYFRANKPGETMG